MVVLSSSARAEKRGLAFVAMPGAGKSTAADRLVQKFGLPKKLSTGDIVRERIGTPYTPEKDAAASKWFAEHPGELGRQLAQRVLATPGDRLVVEGFRMVEDLIEFKKALPGFKVVAIEIGAKRRYERMLDRGRPGEDTVAFLRARDRREIRTGVRQVMRMADFRIRPRGNDFKGLERSLRRVEKYVK